MKKFILTVALSIVGVLGFAPFASAQSLNNFVISSYDVDVQLSRDVEQHSVMNVKETIAADFPEYDQNHGLVRSFVKKYDGHGLAFNLESVTDAQGTDLEYHWNDDNLQIGNANTFVHGRQTYVISYTMHDTTRFYKDVNRDELYWDMLGVDWQVPILQARVKLVVDGELQSALTGQNACYFGASHSAARCILAQNETEFISEASDLQPGEGIAVAIGFKPRTFAAYLSTPSKATTS